MHGSVINGIRSVDLCLGVCSERIEHDSSLSVQDDTELGYGDNIFTDLEILVDKISVDPPDANMTAAHQASNLLDTSDMALFKQQQLDDAILRPYWKLAEQQKTGYFIKGDLFVTANYYRARW